MSGNALPRNTLTPLPDPFIALPLEVSLDILSLIDPFSLAHILAVSKHWCDLTSLTDPWGNACLYIYPETQAVVLTPTAGEHVAPEQLRALSAQYDFQRKIAYIYTSPDILSTLPPWTKMTTSAIARLMKLGLREQFVVCCKDPKAFFREMRQYHLTYSYFQNRIISTSFFSQLTFQIPSPPLRITIAVLIARYTPPPPPPSANNTPSKFHSLLHQALVASTTDNISWQHMWNTLLEDKRRAFWSSLGSKTGDISDPKAREWLCYRMEGSLCVVRGVQVIPFLVSYPAAITQSLIPAFLRPDTLPSSNLIYAPKRIRFSVGFTDNPAQMHYHSRWFDVECINVAQYFDLSPDLVVGHYLFITTEGKPQPTDNLYFVVLQCVKAQGICLDNPSLVIPNLENGMFRAMRATLQKWRGMVMGELELLEVAAVAAKDEAGASGLNQGEQFNWN
ncbi:hypothetical protein BC937DRAFT_91309 [Endogone sp. FLAS-F59071]|nr:hypothetical protein BC937DRAFT_91309 [Endogone sp. FLAS-F59071]|eukprot:RUS21849.1 hypothetical protein BC937DRAFT_91309 [Endogone sp. FLAS-F59071]